MEKLNYFGVDIETEGQERSLVYEVACIYSVVEKKISEYLRPFNLSPSKFNALMIIKHQGGKKGLSQGEIGKRLIVTASNMTRLLDRMSKEQLIERISQAGDRRVNLIKITKKGSDLLDSVWPGYCEVLSSITHKLDNKEVKKLSDSLCRWFDGFE